MKAVILFLEGTVTFQRKLEEPGACSTSIPPAAGCGRDVAGWAPPLLGSGVPDSSPHPLSTIQKCMSCQEVGGQHSGYQERRGTEAGH